MRPRCTLICLHATDGPNRSRVVPRTNAVSGGEVPAHEGAVNGKFGIAEVLRLFTRFACALPSSTERLACAAVRKQFGAGA